MERDIKPTYDELESYVENLQKQLADAQATIAALEETILKMGENAAVVAKDAMAAKEQVAALQGQVRELEDDRSAWKEIAQDWSAAAKLAEQPEKFYEGYSAAVMNAMQALLTKARAEFTQRTAELEAVSNFIGVKYDAESKTWVSGQAPYLSAGTTKQEACIAAVDALRLACATWETKYRDLQAELERVRGELAETKEVEVALSLKVAEYEVELNGDPQNFYGRGRTVGLRALIAALPKVEGEIQVIEAATDEWHVYDAIFTTQAGADNYAAMLQERQKLC